jgi:aspartate aminotransferase
MFSEKVLGNLSRSSGIRAMFEEGEKLRSIYGKNEVFDFTLGNPDPEPPAQIYASLAELINDRQADLHKYMPNAGFSDVRRKVAEYVSKNTKTMVTEKHVIMTVGAAGGLNVVLKALLNSGDEVIAFPPYFVEYGFYVENHGGKLVPLSHWKKGFQPDPGLLEAALTPETKAIIINTPNNPTGAVYTMESLRQIADVIDKKEKEFGTTIYVLSDEPYTRLVYDGTAVPSVFGIFKNSIIITSFSKSLSLPGERIGYAVVNPAIENVGLLMDAMIFCLRVLGYVNAPAMFQKVIADNLDISIDVNIYKERRDILYNFLISLGFKCVKPEGAFYLFPECPNGDDLEFKNMALENRILVVPGRSFGAPGYFRMAYCIDKVLIEKSFGAFKKLAVQAGL